MLGMWPSFAFRLIFQLLNSTDSVGEAGTNKPFTFLDQSHLYVLEFTIY